MTLPFISAAASHARSIRRHVARGIAAWCRKAIPEWWAERVTDVTSSLEKYYGKTTQKKYIKDGRRGALCRI
jgi:hypothetical protein